MYSLLLRLPLSVFESKMPKCGSAVDVSSVYVYGQLKQPAGLESYLLGGILIFSL